MTFKKWVKGIQTVGYNGARTVHAPSFNDENKVIPIDQWRKILAIGWQMPPDRVSSLSQVSQLIL